MEVIMGGKMGQEAWVRFSTERQKHFEKQGW
jgi:hypothetical protein